MHYVLCLTIFFACELLLLRRISLALVRARLAAEWFEEGRVGQCLPKLAYYDVHNERL